MKHNSSAIISIRPQYAEAILCGHKTVELRRKIPDTPRGTLLWIYATMPVGAIVGTAVVQDIVRGTPATIWDAFQGESGILEHTFFEYYRGTDEAIAMLLGDTSRCTPIGIARLRAVLNGFHPPQVLSRLTDIDADTIERSSKAA